MRMLFVGLVTAGLAGCSSIAPPSPQPSGADAPTYQNLSDAAVTAAARQRQRALETLPDGQRLTWGETGTGYRGSVKPYRTYVSGTGLFCREFIEELRLGEQRTAYRSRACRDGDGQWVWL